MQAAICVDKYVEDQSTREQDTADDYTVTYMHCKEMEHWSKDRIYF